MKKKKNNKRMCLVFSNIECIYWCSMVTLLSMFVDESSYVSFPRLSILCIHFVVYFESEMSDLLLGALGHCPFHRYVHYWYDFISCLIWVDHYSSSCSLLHYHSCICFLFIHFISPLVIFLQRLFYSQFDTSSTSSLHISLSDQFFFIASLLTSYSH